MYTWTMVWANSFAYINMLGIKKNLQDLGNWLAASQFSASSDMMGIKKASTLAGEFNFKQT